MDERRDAIERAAERLREVIAKRNRVPEVVVPWMRRP